MIQNALNLISMIDLNREEYSVLMAEKDVGKWRGVSLQFERLDQGHHLSVDSKDDDANYKNKNKTKYFWELSLC